MNIILQYIILTLSIILRAVAYVYAIWFVGRRFAPMKNPFSFSRRFVTDTEKFGVIYLGSDLALFLIERAFLIGFENAIILRLVSTVLSLSTSGFFGRFRTRLRNKIINSKIKKKFRREYLADTIPSFIFRTPIYLGKLSVFAFFNFITRDKVLGGVILSAISVFFFGRFVCRIADRFEKSFIKRRMNKRKKTNNE